MILIASSIAIAQSFIRVLPAGSIGLHDLGRD